jgi:hypothetical protein
MAGGRMGKVRRVLLIAPIPLLITTYIAFRGFTGALGFRAGVTLAFLFYWIVWFLLLPLYAARVRGLLDMLRDTRPWVPSPRWLALILLILPVALGLCVKLVPELPPTD